MIADKEGRTTLRIDTGLEFDNLLQLMLMIQNEEIHVKTMNSRVPSLDSMFLTLTGHDMQTEEHV